jgi:hypothetical protein
VIKTLPKSCNLVICFIRAHVSQQLSVRMGDLFDACLTLEEEHFQNGYDEGRREGRILGRDEGRILGLQKGFELGYELGLYLGCVEALRDTRSVAKDKPSHSRTSPENEVPPNQHQVTHTSAVERKLARLVDTLHGMLCSCSLGCEREVDLLDMQRGDIHPRNEHMQVFMDDVRSKFKVIVAMLDDETKRKIEDATGFGVDQGTKGGAEGSLVDF